MYHENVEYGTIVYRDVILPSGDKSIRIEYIEVHYLDWTYDRFYNTMYGMEPDEEFHYLFRPDDVVNVVKLKDSLRLNWQS